MEYKNYIFDLGGVVVDIDIRRIRQAFADLGMDLDNQPRYDYLSQQYQVGTISSEEFCQSVLEGCHSGTTVDQVKEAWSTVDKGVNLHKLDRILELRHTGHRVFLLSNTNEMHWQQISQHDFVENGYRVEDLFEIAFLSQEMHLAKPDKEIFLRVIREAGINPADTLFVDDTEENVVAARACGLNALHVAPSSDWTNLI